MNSFQSNNLVELIQSIYNSKEIIPLHAPVFNGNEKKYVEETINSTFVSTVGKFVEDFENDIANFVGTKHAIATSSGTTALHIALLVVGCNSESEVITQSLSFIAGCNAISYCNSHPIFIDVEKNTLGMSPESLNNFLLNNCEVRNDGKCYNKKTNRVISACLPTHVYGFSSRIDEIEKICKKFNIALIEDAAESLGSYYKDTHLGTFSKLATFSFNGNKIITSGGGGMVVTNDINFAKKIKHLTTTAKVPHKWEFNHDEIGFNYRMPNINAALGIAQLEQISFFLSNKKKTSSIYKEWCIKNDIKIVEPVKDSNPNFWLNTIIANDIRDRNFILEETNKKLINTRPAWNLLHTLPMFMNCQVEDIPNSIWLFDRIINLPSSVNI
ncbi:LegC family aminotransferase [Pelagibacteraceae bacterium]|nr:LegC family aminotransferase [Pelagibacteraceae bacterium]